MVKNLKEKMGARNRGDMKHAKGGSLLLRASGPQIFIHVTHNGLSEEGLLIVKQEQFMIELSTGNLLYRPAKLTSGRSLLLTEETSF